MNVEIITEIGELRKIKEEWQELEIKEKDTTIFQTYLYNSIWWESVKDFNEYKLNIIVVRDKNLNILGIAPLILEEEKKMFLKIKTLKFMGWGDYLNFLILSKNTNVGKVVSKIFDTINNLKIDRVILTNIDINSNFGNVLRKNERYNKSLEFLTECPQIKFYKYNSLSNYREKFNYSSLNNLKNKLKKDYSYKLIVENNMKKDRFKEISEIHKNLQVFLNKEKKSKNRKSLYEDSRRGYFLEKFYNKSDKILNFLLIDIDDNIIAYETCYINGKRILNWNMAHDSNYNAYSPGRIINLEIIDWFFKQDNFQDYIFDFGCGGYSWKFQWTDDSTSVYKL
ncbi:MAG: GNAT family N-acetyltransferase, partial [Cetobacterium sp.]